MANDMINHPEHYTSGRIEVWDFILDQKLDYLLGNAVKYICRCGKKTESGKTRQAKSIEDLEKAMAYLRKKIEMLSSEEDSPSDIVQWVVDGRYENEHDG